MKLIIAAAAVLTMMVTGFPAGAAGPHDANFRSVFRELLAQVDANKDGKMTVGECKAIYKDKKLAEKNCTFWDADKNGIITEDEYVRQGSSLGKRK